MKVLLTYYKPTGKYYSSAEYEYNNPIVGVLDPLQNVLDEVKVMLETGNLPGLRVGSTKFLVGVDVPEHPSNHPMLVMPAFMRVEG